MIFSYKYYSESWKTFPFIPASFLGSKEPLESISEKQKSILTDILSSGCTNSNEELFHNPGSVSDSQYLIILLFLNFLLDIVKFYNPFLFMQNLCPFISTPKKIIQL